MAYCIFLGVVYHITYNLPNWERHRGWRVHHSREATYPGDPRFPMKNARTESWQHYDRGFHERTVFLD